MSTEGPSKEREKAQKKKPSKQVVEIIDSDDAVATKGKKPVKKRKGKKKAAVTCEDSDAEEDMDEQECESNNIKSYSG